MATFPGGVKSFSVKTDGAGQTIFAAHINDLQDEVVAIQTDLKAGQVGGVTLSQFHAGTVGAPGVAVGDTDVGLYSSGTNALDFTTNGVKALGIDATQFVDSPTQPRARVYNSAAQAIGTGSLTALTFDTEDYDVGGIHDTSSNTSRLTIPTGGDGLYLVTGLTEFAANGTGQRNIRIQKNGSAVGSQLVLPATGGVAMSMMVTALDNAVAGDYYEVVVFQSSGGSLNVGSATRVDANQAQIVKLW